MCWKFGHLVHRSYHQFDVHFTGVIDPTYSSPTIPSVNLSSAHWDDSSETDVSAYQVSSYPAHIPSHSNHPIPGVQPHIPPVNPYLYHPSTHMTDDAPHHTPTLIFTPDHYVLPYSTNITTAGFYVLPPVFHITSFFEMSITHVTRPHDDDLILFVKINGFDTKRFLVDRRIQNKLSQDCGLFPG